MEKRRFNFLKWALVLGIVIVLNLFIQYSINAVYPQPEYQDFCKEEQVTVIPQTQTECTSKGGQWTEDQSIGVKRPVAVGETQQTGYCNMQYTCSKEYEAASDVYRRNVFVTRVILGVLALGISFVVASAPAVALGLSFGGVLSLLIATTGYWSKLGQYVQVIVLGIALAILIWIGIKKIGKDE